VGGRENSNSGLFPLERSNSAVIGRENSLWNSPQTGDAIKRSTAFPTKVFIPAVKPLEIIVDNTAGTASARTLRLPAAVGSNDEELSLSSSSLGGGGGGMAGAARGSSGSIKATEKAIGPWKTILQANGLLPEPDNSSQADKAESANDSSVSQAQDFDDEMKTLAGNVLDELPTLTQPSLSSTSVESASETVNGICKHFLRGKCRFREKCRNSHAIDNCVHCNAKLPKSRLAASAHLSKCYKSRHGGGITSVQTESPIPVYSPTVVCVPTIDNQEVAAATAAVSTEPEDQDEVSLFEALRLH